MDSGLDSGMDQATRHVQQATRHVQQTTRHVQRGLDTCNHRSVVKWKATVQLSFVASGIARDSNLYPGLKKKRNRRAKCGEKFLLIHDGRVD